jgi:hypothetical protein
MDDQAPFGVRMIDDRISVPLRDDLKREKVFGLEATPRTIGIRNDR